MLANMTPKGIMDEKSKYLHFDMTAINEVNSIQTRATSSCLE